MTNTPMSEREKELVEAVRDELKRSDHFTRTRLDKAVSAYDPKPEPVPVIPAWEEFAKTRAGLEIRNFQGERVEHYVLIEGCKVTEQQFNAIRRATSKAPTE